MKSFQNLLIDYEATIEDIEWIEKNGKVKIDELEGLIDLFEKCTMDNTDVALLHHCKKEAEVRFPSAKLNFIAPDVI